MRKGQGRNQVRARLDAVNAELDHIDEALKTWEAVQLMSDTGRLIPVPEAAIRIILAIVRNAYEGEQRRLQKGEKK